MKCRQNSKNVYTIYVAKSAAIRYNISTEENINILSKSKCYIRKE